MNPAFIPKIYLRASAPHKSVDIALGFDEFARSAMDTYRSNYANTPGCSWREFAMFFNKKNYDMLLKQIKRQAGNNPDPDEVFETMMRAYQSVQPRSDEMDERRERFDIPTVKSYVQEMNKLVIEWAVPDVIAANQLWDHLAKHRHGPVGWEEDEDMHFGTDTRTRLNVSQYDGTWLMA